MTGGTGGVISPPGATPRAIVVATQEEWMIACDTAKLARQAAVALSADAPSADVHSEAC
jgi:hypothetical protein